jgi:hypothetical protein
MSLFELRAEAPPAAPRTRLSTRYTGIRGRSAKQGPTPWWTLAAIALAGACGLAAVAGTALVNGDGVFHLIWGRSLAEGSLESFKYGPTPHPALLVLAAATSRLGDDASYVVTYVLFGPLAFGWLLAAVFEVARRLSSRWAAVVAVLVLAASVGVLQMAGAARYDIAFAALVLTAVALEMAHARRGTAPLACLAVAGLIRPEAWLLAGAYWLWLAPRLSWEARARTAALVAVAPLLWATMDGLVTGDPLYSLHATDAGSEGLYRQYTPWDNLVVAGRNVIWYLGVVPLLMLVPAAGLMLRDRPKVATGIVGVLAITVGVFLLLVSQGMASNNRYLLVPVCALAILAAVAVDGNGRRTPRRAFAGALLAALFCLHLVTHLDVYGTARSGVVSAEARYASSRALVELPGVRDALRDCPTVSVPGGHMLHWFAFYGGRAPEDFTPDPRGLTRPDLYIAPGNAEVADAVLTRERFDDDASFRVPPSLKPGPRNREWVLYFSPASGCARGLL